MLYDLAATMSLCTALQVVLSNLELCRPRRGSAIQISRYNKTSEINTKPINHDKGGTYQKVHKLSSDSWLARQYCLIIFDTFAENILGNPHDFPDSLESISYGCEALDRRNVLQFVYVAYRTGKTFPVFREISANSNILRG